MRQNKMVKASFPGTFDPIHYGHIDIVGRAARLFDEVVMAVYDRPLKSLLFSPEERMELVREAFKEEPRIKVTVSEPFRIKQAVLQPLYPGASSQAILI